MTNATFACDFCGIDTDGIDVDVAIICASCHASTCC